MTKQFNTFQELQDYFKRHTDLCMTRKYLAERVEEEKQHLRKDIQSKFSSIKWTELEKQSPEKAVQESAELNYLDEINMFLREDKKITPTCVILYRYRVYAWAIANVIKFYEEEIIANG